MSLVKCPDCEVRPGEEHIDGCSLDSHYGARIWLGDMYTGQETKGWASEGRKDDAGKAPWRLLPWDAIRAIVQVLAFGAQKYSERNWEKGMAWSRPFDALLRHMTAWWEGEAKDPETGYSHLWHAGCCILFLIAFEIRGVGKDDRAIQEK